MASIVAGDFIAIIYRANLTSTGHAMLVCGNLIACSATSPVVSSTVQYSVYVYDSSSSYHGKMILDKPKLFLKVLARAYFACTIIESARHFLVGSLTCI